MSKKDGYFIVIETLLDRFKVELYELDIKINKLDKFLNSDTFKFIEKDKQILLKKLHNVMVEYKNILEKR